MRGRACTEPSSARDNLAASLLSDILLKKRRGVEYQMYLLDHKTGNETIHKREKGVLICHIIALLYKLNVLQTKNRKLSINHKTMEVLNHILTLPYIKLMVNWKRIKGSTHIDIILLDDNTIKHKSAQISHDRSELDINTLNNLAVDVYDKIKSEIDISVLPQVTPIPITPSISDYPHNPPKYPMLANFGIPTDYSTPDTARTINTILKEIEQLAKEQSLELIRDNNTTATVFFVPSKVSSRKIFHN